MADDGEVTVMVVTVRLEVNEKKVKACGAAEWKDGTREPDAVAIIKHRIAGAFSYVDGFEKVSVYVDAP